MTVLVLVAAGACLVWSSLKRRGGGDLAGVDVIRALREKEARNG